MPIKVKIPFAGGMEKISIKQENLVGFLTPRNAGKAEGLKVVTEALKNPVEAEAVEGFLKPRSEILFLVNDGTRHTPTATVLRALEKLLQKVKPSFLVACGAHPPPTKRELERIFGDFLAKYEARIRFNLSRAEDFGKIGDTSLGTSLWLNREALRARRILVISSVEPHYFAGFTGGRKSILPGVASYDSIEQNHRLALKPEARVLALKGNPVHEDMVEAAEAYADGREIYTLLTVLDGKRRIASAFAGDLHKAFYKATAEAERLYAVKIGEKADIVIAVAKSPLDLNLYQAHKALEHGKLALKNDGIIILVAACQGGLGDEQFYRLLTLHDKPEKVLEAVEKKYRLGYHKAAKIAELSLKAEIWAVTSLEGSIVKKAFIKPYRNVQRALNEALKVKGKDARVLIIPDAGLTIPKPNLE
jgi:nickel-dependent lactate racemase